MPDYIDPEVKPPDGFHLVTQALVRFEQRNGFSSFVEPASEPLAHSWQNIRCLHQPDVGSLLRPLTFHHADPITSLRSRDEKALEEIFDDEQLDEILADVYLRLKQLCPEPCWEDDPFDFLQDYV